jgi:REP element-mobilizing transposase RayT
MPDHVHMLISLPPKLTVATVAGVLELQKLDLASAEYSRLQAKFPGPPHQSPHFR